MDQLTPRLETARERLAEVEKQLGDPDVVRDQKRYAELNRAHRDMSAIVHAADERARLTENIAQARQLLADPEMAEMAQLELDEATEALEQLDQRLWILLLPKDPHDDRNTIMEIRAGTGGEEAALFAADLFRVYSRYAEQRGWRIEVLSTSESERNGFKEIIFNVQGDEVFARLKYEGGGHRVQRVPVTETQGRIHTSAVTVAVMPEAEEVDVQIAAEDIKIDVFRSSGPGGQSVNTTDSAVRITHLPTGLVVSCQDEKSQHKNRARALKVLRSRLLDLAESERNAELSQQRREQVGSGDRSQRIRTYNFPQNRVTDHRIKLSVNLDQVMEGNLDLVLDPVLLHYQAERLKAAI